MENKKVANTRKRFALVFVFLGLIGALVILPYQFRSQAGKAQTQAGQPHTEEIGYFDIRADIGRSFSQVALAIAPETRAVAVRTA